jgi:nicotinamide riboside transporter PnuC
MVSQRVFALSVAQTVAYIHVAWSLRAGKRWARWVAFPVAIAPAALDGIAAVLGVVAFVLLTRAWSERHSE